MQRKRVCFFTAFFHIILLNLPLFYLFYFERGCLYYETSKIRLNEANLVFHICSIVFYFFHILKENLSLIHI